MAANTLDFDRAFKLLSLCGAVGSFCWGIWLWKSESEQLADARRIAASQPFLDRQLKLYTEASQIAAALATPADDEKRTQALDRFWELYWGELALVEDRAVEQAMIAFGKSLKAGADRAVLEKRSLQLTHACRESLDRSWGVHAWTRSERRRPN